MASPQCDWLYRSNWTPALDSMLLGTMIRLKAENNWDGTVFPSHFIREAEGVIQRELGYAFDWAALLDQLHFLEKRYKTFKAMLEFHGTRWNKQTNVVKVGDGLWSDILPRNPLAGAYHTDGEPAYQMLVALIGNSDEYMEPERTLILISDSLESCNNDFVRCKEKKYGKFVANDNDPGDHIRRKLVFEDDVYPPDMLSSNNKEPTYYMVGEDGKMSKKVQHVPVTGSGSHQKKPIVPPKVPTYGTDSNSPIMWWRMPGKPM